MSTLLRTALPHVYEFTRASDVIGDLQKQRKKKARRDEEKEGMEGYWT